MSVILEKWNVSLVNHETVIEELLSAGQFI